VFAVAPVAIPSSLVLSAADIAPAADTVALEIETEGVLVPVATWIGATPVTLVTVPVLAVAPLAMPSNLSLSAADMEPAAAVVAAEIETEGVVVPFTT
jgi:hypothetical protein